MTNEEGIRAIIALQKLGGFDESVEKATEGWKNMSEHERDKTISVYTILFGKEKNHERSNTA